jgi:hypothetical protein
MVLRLRDTLLMLTLCDSGAILTLGPALPTLFELIPSSMQDIGLSGSLGSSIPNPPSVLAES